VNEEILCFAQKQIELVADVSHTVGWHARTRAFGLTNHSHSIACTLHSLLPTLACPHTPRINGHMQSVNVTTKRQHTLSVLCHCDGEQEIGILHACAWGRAGDQAPSPHPHKEQHHAQPCSHLIARARGEALCVCVCVALAPLRHTHTYTLHNLSFAPLVLEINFAKHCHHVRAV
jgi:hypothetical protein